MGDIAAWGLVIGTAMFGIRTPDVFVLASDSRATMGQAGQKVQVVEKLFETNGYLYGVSGLSRDLNRGFDPQSLIRDHLLRMPRQSISVTVDELQRLLVVSFRTEVQTLRREDRLGFDMAMEKGTKIILAQWEVSHPAAIALRFTARLANSNDIEVLTERLACPGRDCPNGVLLFELGEREAARRLQARRGTSQGAPDEAAIAFVQAEIDANIPTVGPPVQAAKVGPGGVTWILKPPLK